MRIILVLLIGILCWAESVGQYAPRDNWPGSTAMPKDSTIFIDWGMAATVHRGYQDLRDSALGLATVGDDSMCLGQANGQAVSLGDGGFAVIEFNPPIVNGPGFDFAVFENGFHIRSQGDSDFLELAFVEVSNDGENWFRFPSFSDHDTSIQLNTFDGSRASKVHNLAGKYVFGYGTPFDLEDLKDSTDLDLMAIRFVKVIDVIGSLNDSFATFDSRGHKINDPFPTPFPQGGFDLDAIGVIYNQDKPNGLISMRDEFKPYPNPIQSGNQLILNEEGTDYNFKVYSIRGQEVLSGKNSKVTIQLPAGLYYVEMVDSGIIRKHKLLVR